MLYYFKIRNYKLYLAENHTTGKTKSASRVYFAVLRLALVILLPSFVAAQNISKNFTVNDGLPSNLIYSMVQDDKGFLWIGTDNGVARFDGKNFRVFTTDDGLPDNEILEVRKENDGTIWVNTFKAGPSFFNDKTNRFVDPLNGVNINRDFIKMVLHVRILRDGGIVFYNGNNELVFKDQKYVQLPYKVAFSYTNGNKRSYLYSELRWKDKLHNYVFYKDDKRIDSILLYSADIRDRHCVKFLSNGKLYLLTGKGDFYVVAYNNSLKKFNIQTIRINKELSWFRLTDKYININSADGSIYAFDRNNLSQKYVIAEPDFSNTVVEDNDENIWVGTLSKGLQLYKNNYIKLVKEKENIDKTFLSVLAADDGKLYAGNYFGEILEVANNNQRVLRPLGKDKQIWIRAIISSGKKIFAVSEQGVIVDFKRKVYIGEGLLERMKEIKPFNDSLIIAAGMDPSGGLFKINTITEKATRLHSGIIRISKIETLGGRYIYCGTNDGLFKFDYEANRVVYDFKNTPLAGERILEVETTPEGLVIVATSTKGIYILKDNRIISHLDNEKIIGNTVTDIAATPAGSFWISTRNGLSRVNYVLSGNLFAYTSRNFSMTEGLPANVITDISYRGDTVFLATENGVAFLPENLEIKGNPINTVLTAIKANHESLPLTADNSYVLNASQRSVYLEFSGIDLGGHLKRLQYTFDQKKGWISLDAGDLSLELSAGEHILFVRSVDINSGDTHPITTIFFNVKAPFYQRMWFIMAVAGLIAGLLVYLMYRRRSARQRRKLQSQLQIEQERNRITADLHDDIGSTLSSLQIYSDIAYGIIEKDREKAKLLLQQISNGASKISDNIGDIIWSMKANQAHVLSPESRIKNIVSEALGPTDIDYEMHIDETADKMIGCITCRKNLILIVKEAVNNIAKYSKATKVNVSLITEGKYYILRVKDNGIGMNVEERKFAGNGLTNMMKRMAEVDGHCDIISSTGNGTDVICKFPLAKLV